MRIGVYLPSWIPESFRVVSSNIMRELRPLGVEAVPFDQVDRPPAAIELIWDPRAGGGNPPIKALSLHGVPVIVTLHGVAPMAIPLSHYFKTRRAQLKGYLDNQLKRLAWRRLKRAYAAIITVSEFSKTGILQCLPIAADKIHPCHNGVDCDLFSPGPATADRAGFLHISNDEPRKNVDLICEAYRSLPEEGRPGLTLKLPSDSPRRSGDGITVIRGRLSDQELVDLYRNGLAFVFPSSYEGFGLPIVEAMACGCPVITSNNNACAEVARDNALRVTPSSVEELRAAMLSLMTDPGLREDLRRRGLAHAKRFSWRNSAECHLAVFERVTAGSG